MEPQQQQQQYNAAGHII